eukprot:213940-Rhodomonas_salina.2
MDIQVKLFRSSADCSEVLSLTVPKTCTVRGLRDAVTKSEGSPAVCAAILTDGKKCKDDARVSALCEGKSLIAFMKNQTKQDTAQKSETAQKNSREQSEPTKKHKRGNNQTEDVTSAAESHPKSAKTNTRNSGRNRGQEEDVLSTPPVDLLYAAALAAEGKGKPKSRGAGAAGEAKTQGGGEKESEGGDEEEQEDGHPRLPQEHARILEGFRVLNQLYEVVRSNHLERVTVQRLLAHGAGLPRFMLAFLLYMGAALAFMGATTSVEMRGKPTCVHATLTCCAVCGCNAGINGRTAGVFRCTYLSQWLPCVQQRLRYCR